MEKRILIIDDDPTLRLNLGSFFKDKGYKSFEADNGKTGIELMKTERPDAILLDVMIPGMNGIETIKAISESHPEMLGRITLMTSSSSMNYLSDAVSLGVLKYINKGDMSLDNIFKTIDNYA